MTGVYAELMGLAEKIDSEASISARSGQLDRLEQIARQLRHIARTSQVEVPRGRVTAPIAAVGEEPLEPLVSTATTARKRSVRINENDESGLPYYGT